LNSTIDIEPPDFVAEKTIPLQEIWVLLLEKAVAKFCGSRVGI